MMNVKMKTFIIAIVSSLIGLSGCKMGVFGKIGGTVIEVIDGKPLVNKVVKIDEIEYLTTTDSLGNFFFPNIPIGIYTMHTDGVGTPYVDCMMYNVKVVAESTAVVRFLAPVIPAMIHESQRDAIKLSSFKTDAIFFKGRWGAVTSGRSPLTCIVGIRHDEKRIITRISGLSPFVTILNPEQAIEAVRLFTSLNTYTLFHEPNPDNVLIEVFSTDGKPGYGEMPAHDFHRFGLFSPRASADDFGFIIERFCISYTYNLYNVHERMTADGMYTLLSKSLVLSHQEIPLPVR